MARHFASGSNLTRVGAARVFRPLSIACWAKPSSLVANACLCSVQETDGANGGWFLRLDGTTHARIMDYDGSSVVDAISAGSLTVGAWQHVAATISTTNYVYLNGVQSAGATGLLANRATTATYVGALLAGAIGFGFDGDLAEMSIWSSILSPADIALLAAGQSAALVQPGTLAAYYKILGTSNPEPDEKGGTSLTLFGSPPLATHPPILYTLGSGAGRMFQVF